MKAEENFQDWFLLKCCICGNWFPESGIREPEFIAYNEMGEPGPVCKKCYEQESTTFHEIK